MQKNHHTWVVVADSTQAKIFRLAKFPKLEEIAYLEHPESRLHNQDLVSSKPGRGFQSFGNSRSSYQQETEPRQVEAIKFASEVANYLYTASNKGDFNKLYLFSEPSFLGLLRQHLHQQVNKCIAAEVAKELTSSSIEEIQHHLAALQQ